MKEHLTSSQFRGLTNWVAVTVGIVAVTGMAFASDLNPVNMGPAEALEVTTAAFRTL